MALILRGQIYWADLGTVTPLPSGDLSIEIAHRRPVIIISTDAINRVSERKTFYVLVMPGTLGASSFRSFPTNVRLHPVETGLKEEGVFQAHHIRSIDVRRLSSHPIGRISGKAMERIEAAMRYVFNLGR